MNDSYDPKNKFSKFISGKGFYAALAVCVIGAGTAAWVAVDKTISRIDEGNNKVIEQKAPEVPQEPTYGFPDLEEAGKAQNNIVNDKSSSSSSSSTASSSSQAAVAEQPEPSAEVKAQPTPPPSSFVLPIAGGEIFTPFSGGELVKSATLKAWKTHDGIDIKAALGTQVKAVCDGKVIAVRDDPLTGMTVEIMHHDQISSIYCGLDKQVAVKEGDKIQVGQNIGVVGEIPCEISLEPHLHFGMKVAGKWADPLKTMGKIS